MRTLLVLTLASLTLSLAAANHAPRPGCETGGDGFAATGMIQFGVDDSSYFLVPDDDGDAAGPHIYEDTNGVGTSGDVAHALQREENAADHEHPDLPVGCQDPLVVPDLHVW